MDAKALIEEIRAEKSNAVASGILREEKPLAVITDKEKPHELPEGWQWCRLGDYAMKVTDYVASGSFASLKENVLITNEENYAVMVKTADFSNGFTKNLTYTDEHGYKFLENSNLYGGELILSNIGSIGKVFIVPDLHRPMTLASNTVMIRMTHNEYNKYMYYLFLSPFGQKLLMSISSGTSMLKFNKTQLKSTVIPVAPLEKQYQICNILDKVQQIISGRKDELTKLDELIKARFVEMFGDPKLNPNKYPVHQLSEYIRFLTSGSRGWAEYCVDDGLEWFITIKNVKDCHITTDNMQPVNAPDNAEAKRTRVQEGDLLISITADLGRTGVVSKEIADHGAYINQHLTCIRLNRHALEPLYVAYFMESSAGKEQFISKNQSAVKAGLNFNSINTLQLIVPPLTVQQEFLRFVAQIDKSKVAVQAALGKAQFLFDSLMQQYFG